VAVAGEAAKGAGVAAGAGTEVVRARYRLRTRAGLALPEGCHSGAGNEHRRQALAPIAKLLR
jgi:hypothetical protein